MIFRILEDQYAERAKVAKAAEKAGKAADRRFMQLALTLGRRGLGRTGTNPAVGAVLVKDGVIVGRGWTQDGGRPHAEVEALARAGAAARGATLYVTLEPCSHHGRSPPCADAIIAAGVARVVSAIEDPNPLVGGQGHAKLRAAGIAVDLGLCAEEAARDHAGHLLRVREKRPHVVLKLAVSTDDKIAAAGHKTVAITGEEVRLRVHLLRAQSDAILVGIGTVLADDPELTVRLPGMAAQSPTRVVLDRSLRIPGDSRLVHSARTTPLWLMASDIAEAAAATRLGAAGAQVIHVADCEATPGLDLPAVLRALSDKGVTRLLVEGGARVASAFVAAKLADEIWLLRGDKTIGEGGVDALDGLPLTAITQSPAWRARSSERLGPDILTIYEPT
ncbi:bifunctional diaminohydroxyphosphoribosylaminopyrimidine deaminase/5-amino-6-(5-phosphoribosylamino)uracil reductase RibD [Rhodopseudomonas palustris]|uniref:bifunctional diaminohydroxyphosphoribosylaminopyrimidine deaminase/5-amino-6-(5-phosphoribosylamino)uracil reductase RibD n=1 Tax=Rhodopseudomonas palustris TaxID=1076 RepID=UPI002ACDA9F2|nr:bifunctional diaminohydroxyphosphoribosylaminopyrimidine deaminase/5-amino-6-(5-phosphoribosylamino)uracil reductase RibD [Rhodopseudomonas palustris]WQH00943.1 bifunctional diaminohydroxyphosphoribosylaminopyrimidine deaminase/5-amino-6-(5-phosphoribosylamino)uracil reductase RibD [Rhodopseudomonas palustris]